MKVFFYLIGIFFILHELSWIFSPVKNANESRRFYHLVKSKKKLKLGEFTEEDKSLILSKTFTTLFYLLWMLIGLFSFNWLVFLAYLIVGFGIMSPLGLLTRDTKFYPLICWVNSCIGLAVGLFVIINSYHLKIDLWEWLKTMY